MRGGSSAPEKASAPTRSVSLLFFVLYGVVTDEGTESDDGSVALEGVAVEPEPGSDEGVEDVGKITGDSSESITDTPEVSDLTDASQASETTEVAEPGTDVAATGEDTDGSERVQPGQGSPARQRRYRGPVWALTRAVVVLAAAAAGYQAVVPYTHPVRSRLSRLAVTKPGVKAFDVKPTAAKQLPTSQAGLSAVVSAGKKSPNSSGAYTVEWAPSSTKGAGLLVFLLPNKAQAAKTLAEVKSSQLGTKAYLSSGLARHSTYKVPGVPGSAGSLYLSTAKPPKTAKSAAKPPSLAVDAFQFGRTVALTETVSPTNPQAAASTVALTELRHLRAVEPNFTLMVVSRSTLATALWAAGSVLLAALAALFPYGWRWRRRRKQRRYQAELDRRVVVGGQVIMKRRR